MTDQDLEIAYNLKRIREKAKTDFNELEILKKEHLSTPEKELAIAKVGHGWVTVNADDKIEVIDILIAKAKKRLNNAEKAFSNFFPK
ncbi:MAG TPA: hypothetical protein DCQ50_14620 [Chryseobacterium sp.]|nr:hypothetical protein [Chryseobacterium sp.]